MLSTATKSPKLLTRFSITTELPAQPRALLRAETASTKRSSIVGTHLLDRIEGNMRALQPGLDFAHPPRSIIHHKMNSIARKHQA